MDTIFKGLGFYYMSNKVYSMLNEEIIVLTDAMMMDYVSSQFSLTQSG